MLPVSMISTRPRPVPANYPSHITECKSVSGTRWSAAHVEPERVGQEGCSGQECQAGSGLELDFLFIP